MCTFAAGVCCSVPKAIPTKPSPTAHLAYQKHLQAALLHYTRLGHISQVPIHEGIVIGLCLLIAFVMAAAIPGVR
jgi:hypothetical protein